MFSDARNKSDTHHGRLNECQNALKLIAVNVTLPVTLFVYAFLVRLSIEWSKTKYPSFYNEIYFCNE